MPLSSMVVAAKWRRSWRRKRVGRRASGVGRGRGDDSLEGAERCVAVVLADRADDRVGEPDGPPKEVGGVERPVVIVCSAMNVNSFITPRIWRLAVFASTVELISSVSETGSCDRSSG